jgi:cytochrome c peroxidase
MKLKIILIYLSLVLYRCADADQCRPKMLHTPTPIAFKIPAGFPKPPTNIYKNNRLTEEGFQLGKKLFYDGRLSKDGEVSCASCHQQYAAFLYL